MKNSEIIGVNIKKYREKHALTQAQLAERLFVSFQAISAWERGQSLPDLENVMRMAKIFGISVDMLLHDYDEELFVGIDGGGSKTEFCAVLADGTVKKRVVVEGTNPNDIGIEACVERLYTGLERLLPGGQMPCSIFAGVAGMTVGQHKSDTEKSLKNRYRTEVYADSDAVNVLAMGKDPQNAALVICGTGSCIFVRRSGVLKRVGGWGQLFDESGSAYDIGKDAVRHTLAVYDGLEQESMVSKGIERALGCDIWQGLGAIYEKGRAYIATLSACVVEAYASGDAIAKAILDKNAKYLGGLIAKAKEKYGVEDAFLSVGGFFENCPAYPEMVRTYAGCEIHRVQMPPVYGACLEALRRSGRTPAENFEENFKESYRRVLC